MTLQTNLIKKYEVLLRNRRNWEPMFQEVADHLIPRKANITIISSTGAKKQKNRYTSTGMHAHEVLAANLQGTLTSRAFRWFDLRLGSSREEKDLESRQEVRGWLQECSRRLWMAFNMSNLQSQGHEFYLDITAFGTACTLHEQVESTSRDFSGFNFTTYPIESYLFEENKEGRVDRWCALLKYTAEQAVEKFGLDVMPPKIKRAYEKKEDDVFGFLHWIFPRESFDVSKKTASNMPFASIYISLEGKKQVKQGGYKEFPTYVARWTKNSGERYGRGPGDVALPDLKVLDKATELDLNAWAKYIDPPWFTEDDGVIGTVDLRPGKGTVVRDKDSMWFYEFRGRPDAGRLQLDTLRQSIRQTFFADQLELPQSDRMTAEEIRTRVELMQRVLGPTLGRLESEYLDPMIARGFRMMLEGDAFPIPPADITEAGAQQLEVHYSGPLARSERMAEISAADRWIGSLAQVANVDPTVMDIVDTDEYARLSGENLDVPEQLIRNKRLVEEVRKQRAERQAQEREAQLGLVQSETQENLARAQTLQ